MDMRVAPTDVPEAAPPRAAAVRRLPVRKLLIAAAIIVALAAIAWWLSRGPAVTVARVTPRQRGGNRLCDRRGRTRNVVALDPAGARPHHRTLPLRGQDRQEGRSARAPRRQGSAGHAERSARAGGVPAPGIRPPVAIAGARGGDLAGLSARRERPGAHPGADRRAGPAAGILQAGVADGRHRAEGGRRGRRHGRSRHHPLPHRPGKAAMGRRRRQRGGHSPRPGRPEGAAAHRRVRRPGAARLRQADHAGRRSRLQDVPRQDRPARRHAAAGRNERRGQYRQPGEARRRFWSPPMPWSTTAC